MSEELLVAALGVIHKHGPLSFRKIEAHLVLAGWDVPTYDVQVAVGRLHDRSLIVRTDNFLYDWARDK